MQIIVGTAGHIDHGKTALTRALTGVDTDRLPEEKARGITVDLGFAEMLADDVRMGFVDVPGHERFVKNMLAGASGIDLVLLIIAADEGVMPQTREHFDICRLLDVRSGIVVLTKSDLVDADTLELARLEAAELVRGSFLEASPIITVSAQSGSGIEELKTGLVAAAAFAQERDHGLIARLSIDRSFSVKGFGAVATGTLASGSLKVGTEMELLPEGLRVRVRGLQSHGKDVPHADAGQRVAVNLGGIDHSKVHRGMLLAEAGVLEPAQNIDVAIEMLASAPRPLRTRQRVRVHIGTAEVLARVHVLEPGGEIAAGEKGFVQLRLESPIACIPRERFIIRQYSPATTIGGGQVVANAATRHRHRDLPKVRDLLKALFRCESLAETYRTIVSSTGRDGIALAQLRSRTGADAMSADAAAAELVSAGEIIDAGGLFVSRFTFDNLKGSVGSVIERFHREEPLARGISRELLLERTDPHVDHEIFASVLAQLTAEGKIILDRDVVRSSTFSAELTPSEKAFVEQVRSAYRSAGLEVERFANVTAEAAAASGVDARTAAKLSKMLLDSGELVKVTDEFYFLKSELDKLIEKLQEFAAASTDRTIDVARFKELAGVSRKYAIPLIEYFDRERVTVRRGDTRVII